jgi:hypothetical protein
MSKKAALNFFLYILGFLAVIAIIGFSIKIKNTLIKNPEHCGGNILNAPKCASGFHCAPVPGSHLPFGDVGGTCVPDLLL